MKNQTAPVHTSECGTGAETEKAKQNAYQVMFRRKSIPSGAV